MITDDLVGLIVGDHAHIVRLSEELEGAAGSPARLAALWAELHEVLLAHLGAFEEIFFLPLLGAIPDRSLSMRDLNAQKRDILDAVAEARLQQAGSPLWWLAVRAARGRGPAHQLRGDGWAAAVRAADAGVDQPGTQSPVEQVRGRPRQRQPRRRHVWLNPLPCAG